MQLKSILVTVFQVIVLVFPFGSIDAQVSVEEQHLDGIAVRVRDRAPFSSQFEVITGADGLASSEVDVTVPLLFVETSPPPLVKTGFTYTRLFSGEDFDLPDDLYEYTIGLSWIRPVNSRWTIRTMLGVGLATDGSNRSSDAWQFRGGIFGMYRQNPQITWTFGALATGRDDLPVIPAVGAVWLPNSCTRVDLLFPQPRINWLLGDDTVRQQTAYFGFGINGTTWGIESPMMGDDRLTYKGLRLVLGWESRPSTDFARPFSRGRSVRAEFGYVFNREFEFDDESQIATLRDGVVFSLSTQF